MCTSDAHILTNRMEESLKPNLKKEFLEVSLSFDQPTLPPPARQQSQSRQAAHERKGRRLRDFGQVQRDALGRGIDDKAFRVSLKTVDTNSAEVTIQLVLLRRRETFPADRELQIRQNGMLRVRRKETFEDNLIRRRRISRSIDNEIGGLLERHGVRDIIEDINAAVLAEAPGRIESQGQIRITLNRDRRSPIDIKGIADDETSAVLMLSVPMEATPR